VNHPEGSTQQINKGLSPGLMSPVKQRNVFWHKPTNVSVKPATFTFGVKVSSVFYPENLGSWSLQNFCKFPPDYMVLTSQMNVILIFTTLRTSDPTTVE
jgi:hypothetical protein